MTQGLGQVRSSRVLRGSVWILVGLAIQSGLGFAFWLLGSRVATDDELGRAAALFTAIQFVNYVSGLGLTIALARYATDRSRESDAIFAWGVAATIASSFIGGAAYLAIAQQWPDSATSLVTGSVGGWVLFCCYTAGTSVGLLVDVRLMAARRWGWLVGRLALVGLVRLPLVSLDVAMAEDLWLYNLMLAPLALAGILAVPLLGKMGAGGTSWRRPASLAAVARYSGVNWLATLASQAPQFVLPLVVAETVASGINANFFLAWTVTGLVFLVPGAISQVLLVEGSKDADDPDATALARRRSREALAFSLTLCTLAFLASLVVGPLAASLLGDDYERFGRLLPALTLAAIPWALTSVRLAEARIRRDQAATVSITLALGLGILVPTLVLVPGGGGTGAAAGAWLFGNVAGAVTALAMHARAQRARPARPGPGDGQTQTAPAPRPAAP